MTRKKWRLRRHFCSLRLPTVNSTTSICFPFKIICKLQMSGCARKKFQVTYLTMPNNFFFMKYAQKSVPGLADVGVPHGDGDGPRTSHRCLQGSEKKFQMTNLTMPNNMSSMKKVLIQSLALLMLRFSQGMGMAPELHPDVWRGQEKVSNDYFYYVEQ